MQASDFSRTQSVCYPASGNIYFTPMFLKWVSCDTHISGHLKCARTPTSKIICACCSFVMIILKHLSSIHLDLSGVPFPQQSLVKPVQQLAMTVYAPCTLSLLQSSFSHLFTHKTFVGDILFWTVYVLGLQYSIQFSLLFASLLPSGMQLFYLCYLFSG